MRLRRKVRVEPECPQNGGRKESGFWNGCTRNNKKLIQTGMRNY
jgi:hypothetical protein